MLNNTGLDALKITQIIQKTIKRVWWTVFASA